MAWTTPTRAVRTAGAAFTLLALLAACGKQKVLSPDLVAPQRLELTPVVESQMEREAKRVKRLTMPTSFDNWTVEGGEAEIVQRKTRDRKRPVRAVRLAPSKTDRSLRVPMEFDPTTFNRIVLTLISPARSTNVRAVLMQDGKSRVGTEARVPIERTNVPRAFLLELPTTRRVNGMLDELELSFAGGDDPIEILYIDLLFQPIASWYPDPADGSALIKARKEHRRSWALFPEHPLRGEFFAPENGVFSFSYALPEESRTRGARPSLQLTLAASDGETKYSRKYALEQSFRELSEWHSAEVDLTDFVGQKVTARFDLNGYPSSDGMCAVGEATVAVPAAEPPTVLLITSDTHRADHVGTSGSGVEVKTPTLDALAERGIYFEDCLSSSNITNPSHIGIMTGTHMRDFRIVENVQPISGQAGTLAEAFHAAGYTTYAAVSAPHLAPEFSGLGQGFDRFAAPLIPKRDGQDTIKYVKKWLPEAEDKPLFIWLHLFDAHAPYHPPGGFDRHYYPGGRDPFDESSGPLSVPRELLPHWVRGLHDASFPDKQYAAEVTYLDDQLKQLLQTQRLNDSILCLTADHGESLTEHDILWTHAELYPVSLQVPLILSYPGAPAGTRVSKEIHNLAIGRTLLHLAGVETDFPGDNLLDALEDDHPDRQPRFALAANRTAASVTHEGWHLMLHLREHVIDKDGLLGRVPKHSVQLFNLNSDPECNDDVVENEHEVTTRLRALLVAWLVEADDLGWAGGLTTDANLRQQLAQLGYAEGGSEESAWDWFDADCECEYCAKYGDGI